MAARKTAKKINVKIGKRRRRKTTSHSTPARRRRRSVSGTRKAPRRRGRGGSVGAIKAGTIKQIAFMALGVAAGAAMTHFVLRPVERKITDKWPKLGKVLPTGEVFLGGIMALGAKNSFLKAVGIGILSGGVHGLFKQFNVFKHTPVVNGYDDMNGFDEIGAGGEYSDIRVPISGTLDDMISGILEDSRRDVRTATVSGLNSYTSTVADTVEGYGDSDEDFVKS